MPGLIKFTANKLCFYRHRFMLNREPFAQRGRNVVLFNGSIMQRPKNIYFGNDIYIGPEAYFWVEAGRLIFHDNVILGPRVSIATTQHRWRNADFLPFGYVSDKADVEIFSNVWIGMYSILLPGVRIGEGAVCAAGSLIHRSVPPLAIVGGNPAQVRSYRDPEEYLKLRNAGKFWMAHYEEMVKRGLGPTGDYQPRETPIGIMSETEKARLQRETSDLDWTQFQC